MDPEEIRTTVRQKIGLEDDTDSAEPAEGTISTDKLDGEQIEEAIEYLSAIGRESSIENIEEAAYHLENVDEDAELFSAFENEEERSLVDRKLVAPSNMEENKKWHTRDGDFYKILTATSMPRLVTPGWLVPITLSEYDVRLSVHIQPRETSSVKGKLQQRLTQMKSAIQWKKKRGRTDVYEEEHEQSELERLLRNIIEGKTQLYNVGMYFEVHGETKEKMEEASRKIKRSVQEQGMELTPVEGRQLDAQQAMLPVGTDPIRNYNAVQLEALATFFNFIEPPISDPDGVLMGFDDSKRPVILDRFDLSGHSKTVTGKVGGGKTYAVKLTIYRRLLNMPNMQVFMFDPLGDDFVDFTEKLGGTVIEFGGDDVINPLEIHPPDDDTNAADLYTTKVRSVIEILKTYFNQADKDGMTAGEEGVINQCIHYAYASNGITADPSTFDNPSPTLDTVREGCRIIAEGGLESETSPVSNMMADGAGTMEDATDRVQEIMMDPPQEHVNIANKMLPKFESFSELSVNKNLNGRTNIDLSDNIICFDMNQFADTGEMPLIMHTMLDWAYQETRRSSKFTDVTFEEAHYLLDRPGARNLLNLFIRHARHFLAGLTLISQTPDEFLYNKEKREIYDNCDIKQMFYQENVSAEVIEYFDFSDEEARFLRQAARGQSSNFSECLLSTSEHGRRRLEVYADPFERHVVEEGLDPEGYIEQQGIDRTSHDDSRGKLADVADSDKVTATEGENVEVTEEREFKPATSDYEENNSAPSETRMAAGDVASPSDVTSAHETVEKDGYEDKRSEKDGSTEDDGPKDPFRVKGSKQADVDVPSHDDVGDPEQDQTRQRAHTTDSSTSEVEGEAEDAETSSEHNVGSVYTTSPVDEQDSGRETEELDPNEEITVDDVREAQEESKGEQSQSDGELNTDEEFTTSPLWGEENSRDELGSSAGEQLSADSPDRSSLDSLTRDKESKNDANDGKTANNNSSRLSAILTNLPLVGTDDEDNSEPATSNKQRQQAASTNTPSNSTAQVSENGNAGKLSRVKKIKSAVPLIGGGSDSEELDDRQQVESTKRNRRSASTGKQDSGGLSDGTKWLIKILPLIAIAIGLFVYAMM